MKHKILNVIKHNKGAAFIMMAFVAIVMFIFFMAAIEILKVSTVSYNVNTQLVRLVNNAVETNIDDEWRIDGYNQLTSLQDAFNTFEANFHFYTQSSAQGNKWVSPKNNSFISGSCFAEADDSSDPSFLYMIDIESISGNDGIDQPIGQQTPFLTCSGTIYIANSIPGMLDTFVFEIPFTIHSVNFRINEVQKTEIEGDLTYG